MEWKRWLFLFMLIVNPYLICELGGMLFGFWGAIIGGVSVECFHLLCYRWIMDRFEEKVLGNRKHESGLPMAEWEERQRLKELDEKLQTGKYTSAEKEHLIYTANLTSENKNTLRQKHLPSQKNSL